MWKYVPFFSFLQDMVENNYVGEIIIIDNDRENRPDLETLKDQKISVLEQTENIYVNPAWNLGVKHAKFDNICLYGDDLVFDLRVFKKMLPHISPLRGVYGICPGNVELGQKPMENGNIDIEYAGEPYHYKSHFGYGMLMFLHKSNWIEIPQELKLYWGDNFIFDTQYCMMRQNYFITNTLHHTPFAATVSKIAEHGEMLNRESEAYGRIMPELIRNLIVENQYRTGLPTPA